MLQLIGSAVCCGGVHKLHACRRNSPATWHCCLMPRAAPLRPVVPGCTMLQYVPCLVLRKAYGFHHHGVLCYVCIRVMLALPEPIQLLTPDPTAITVGGGLEFSPRGLASPRQQQHQQRQRQHQNRTSPMRNLCASSTNTSPQLTMIIPVLLWP